MPNLSQYSPALDGFPIPGARLAVYQEEVVRWLSEFLYTGPRAQLSNLRYVDASLALDYFINTVLSIPLSYNSASQIYPSTGDLRSFVQEEGAVNGRNHHSSEGSTSGIDLGSQSNGNGNDLRATSFSTGAFSFNQFILTFLWPGSLNYAISL